MWWWPDFLRFFCAPFPYHILNFPVAKTVEESGKEAWKEMNVMFGEIFQKVLVERQNILCAVFSKLFSRESPWKDKIYHLLLFKVIQNHFPENHLGRTQGRWSWKTRRWSTRRWTENQHHLIWIIFLFDLIWPTWWKYEILDWKWNIPRMLNQRRKKFHFLHF